jgi:ABC-type oligopeptide transport system ATPase subunit
VVIERGRFTALIGPLGSGKSTFPNLVSLLEEPTGGQIIVNGRKTVLLLANEVAHFRNEFVTEAVITVSAYFNDSQAFKTAFQFSFNRRIKKTDPRALLGGTADDGIELRPNSRFKQYGWGN